MYFRELKLGTCSFHFGQAFLQRVSDLGLRIAYIEDETVRIFTKIVVALALLPCNLIISAFEQLDELKQDDFCYGVPIAFNSELTI